MKNKTPKAAPYQTTTYLAVVVLLVIVFVSVGYHFMVVAPSGVPDQSDIMQEFKANLQRWTERRPVSARYVVDRHCACATELTEAYVAMEERSEKTAEFPPHIQDRFDGQYAVPRDPVWIDELFDVMRLAISDGTLKSVNYDFEFGYPSFVQLQAGATNATGVEQFEIRDFEIIRIND